MTKKKPVLELTALQKRSVDIYHAMAKPNKLKACREAGYTLRGKHAADEARKTFRLAHVKAYHDSLKKAATKKAQKAADEIIAELEILAFSNIGEYLSFSSKGVKLKSSRSLTKRQMAAISEVSEYKTKLGTKHIRFKLYDKAGCLERLGKRFGLFPNRQELTGADGGPLPPITVILEVKK